MIINLKYMDIEYTDNDLEYIDYISNEIENKSKEIVDFFEINDFDKKVKIVLFDSVDKFRNFYKETFKREPKDYVCGFSKGDSVYTLSLNEYKKCLSHEESTIEDLIKLILHEFTHSVHSKRNSNMPCMWLNEGAATYLSNQYEDKKEIRCSLDDFINKKCFYSDYKLMFEYVLNTYGKEYILKLIDDKELLDKDSKRLFEEAKKYYNNIVFDSEHINYIKLNNKYIDDYLNIYNDKEMQLFIFGKEKEFTKEQIENWINRVLNNNSNTFTMIEKDTNNFIGIIEIINIKDNNGEIAIEITPKMQNKHYGTEAMNTIIEYGYKNIGLKSIDVNVHKSNLKAIRLYENTGFVQDKDYEESIHMKHNK